MPDIKCTESVRVAAAGLENAGVLQVTTEKDRVYKDGELHPGIVETILNNNYGEIVEAEKPKKPVAKKKIVAKKGKK